MGWGNADELLERGGIERFIFEQFPGDELQLIAMAGENRFGFIIGASEDFLDLSVDELGSLFAAIALEGAVHAWQHEAVLLLSAAGEADGFAHAEKTNHLAGQGGSMFEIVFRAGGHFVEDDFFGRTATEHAANAIQQLRTSHEKTIVGWQLHRVAQCSAATRDDADFVDGVCALAVSSNERMTNFVISDASLF